MKIKYLIFLILIIAAGLNLISCQPEEPKPIAPTNIIVNSAAKPEETFISKQEIPLPNCAGSAELSMSLGSVTTIQKGVTIGTKATAGAKTGIDIPAAASAELAASVEGSYQQAYQTTVTHLSTMIMSAAPHTSIIYVIEWDNQDYASTVDFDDKNDVGMHYKTDYHYTLTVPKFSDSLSQPCPNGPTPTNVTSVQAPEEFIRHYFSLVTYYRDYHLAWSLLTTAFQEKNDPGGYDDYVAYWNSVDQVDVDKVEVYERNDDNSARCRVKATFHNAKGAFPVEFNFHLIYDATKDTWMIDTSSPG